jgi:hypothetical protein
MEFISTLWIQSLLSSQPASEPPRSPLKYQETNAWYQKILLVKRHTLKSSRVAEEGGTHAHMLCKVSTFNSLPHRNSFFLFASCKVVTGGFGASFLHYQDTFRLRLFHFGKTTSTITHPLRFPEHCLFLQTSGVLSFNVLCTTVWTLQYNMMKIIKGCGEFVGCLWSSPKLMA